MSAPPGNLQSPTAKHHDGSVHDGQGRHDDRETLLHGKRKINQLHDGTICNRDDDHRTPSRSPSGNGLGPTEYSEIYLSVGQERNLNITIQPATVKSEVTVSGGELTTLPSAATDHFNARLSRVSTNQ